MFIVHFDDGCVLFPKKIIFKLVEGSQPKLETLSDHDEVLNPKMS